MYDRAAAVICAAGSSSRMGGIKKEFQILKKVSAETGVHVTVLGSSVRAFASVPSIETIVIAVPEDGESAARGAVSAFLDFPRPKILFVKGGESRRASVFNALSALSPFDPSIVLIHDGARPWVTPSLIEKIIEEVKIHGAVIPALMLTDTPKECDAPLPEFPSQEKPRTVFIKRHLKRADTVIAQTPQGFRFREILEAHEKAAVQDGEFTDDAEVWGRFCGSVAVIPGSPENRKITFPEDIEQ